MLEHLFGSKTRLKLLKLFLSSPDKIFFVREISRALNVPINAVRREIDHLILAEIIETSEGGAVEKGKGAGADKKKFFRLNSKGALLKELDSLLMKDRFSKEQVFVTSLKDFNGVEFLLLSGRFVGDKETPIDILLVGSILPKDIEKVIKQFEKEIGEEIRYTLMKTKEFLYRRDVADKFLTDLFSKKNLILLDHIKVSKHF
ncbi:MAG: hypothetical protein NTU97_04500 [Candidatus Magasanikbacteria bacterium]|nr:hypothetical protein [Candidatus Magasanikbacteria bacterium]